MERKLKARIAVVIPCYRVKDHIRYVLEKIGETVDFIFVVDDHCPENSGKYVEAFNKDRRVKVIYHESNLGVGGAVLTGYKVAIHAGADIIVKIDGDGQMNPDLVPNFIKPLIDGTADYVKGNRFHSRNFLQSMPVLRLLGNSMLSLINKVVSGYWDIMDPSNGFTAIHGSVVNMLPLERIDKRYFFESDMLFWLSTLRAVIKDIPMKSVYENESSSLQIRSVLFEFPMKYCKRFFQRIFYLYFLRDFNAGTVQLISGIFFTLFSLIFGGIKWLRSMETGIPATSGTVMLAALPLFVGIQMFISAINFDINSVPKNPIQENRW